MASVVRRVDEGLFFQRPVVIEVRSGGDRPLLAAAEVASPVRLERRLASQAVIAQVNSPVGPRKGTTGQFRTAPSSSVDTGDGRCRGTAVNVTNSGPKSRNKIFRKRPRRWTRKAV